MHSYFYGLFIETFDQFSVGFRNSTLNFIKFNLFVCPNKNIIIIAISSFNSSYFTIKIKHLICDISFNINLNSIRTSLQ